MRQTITQGLIQGQSVPVMAKGLADSLGKSYVAAERLVRTETSHFHNAADMSAYEAVGVEEYEFMATLDVLTCSVCGALDGKHFKLSEAQVGVNYPPIHPNDRCTTIEYDPEDAADWAASGKPMPKNMTYEEWKAEQEKEYGTGYVEIERKKAYNYSKDKEQLDRYAERLGKDNVPNLDVFQEMKYRHLDEWKELTGFYAYKGKVPEATKSDFISYKKIKETWITGTVRVPPEAIDSDSLVFADAHAERHGVTIEQARGYVKNALFSVSRKRWDGVKVNYYSKDGATYTSEDIKINTAFSKADFDDLTKKAVGVFGE